MKKDPAVFIEHILESIEKIEVYSGNLTKERLIKDTKIQDAIVRRIEIVRTRDKIIHHYFGVDLDVVWDIIKTDIPQLRKKMKAILREMEKEGPLE